MPGRGDLFASLTQQRYPVGANLFASFWSFGRMNSPLRLFPQSGRGRTCVHEPVFRHRDCRKGLGPKNRAYFRERQARGEPIAFDAWLAASRDVEPVEGDELP